MGQGAPRDSQHRGHRAANSSRERSAPERSRKQIGDVSKAITGAATKVEAIYQVPFLAHACMEPMNCTVHVRKDGCEVWVGTQVLARAQAAAAQTAGLPLERLSSTITSSVEASAAG